MVNQALSVVDDRSAPAVVESLVLRGDISGLKPADKVAYYVGLCKSVGLDPATTPFLPLKLNGKEIMYASKGCAEQLRKLHNVDIQIVSRVIDFDILTVTCRAKLPNGRCDEDIGSVPVGGLKGEALANASMKANTKAKRRVTLSILGLGMLDESELDTIPAHRMSSAGIAESMQGNGEVLEAKPAKATDLPPPPASFVMIPEEVTKLSAKWDNLKGLAGRTIEGLTGAELTMARQHAAALVKFTKNEANKAYWDRLRSDIDQVETARALQSSLETEKAAEADAPEDYPSYPGVTT